MNEFVSVLEKAMRDKELLTTPALTKALRRALPRHPANNDRSVSERVREWLRGKGLPSDKYLDAIEAVLGISHTTIMDIRKRQASLKAERNLPPDHADLRREIEERTGMPLSDDEFEYVEWLLGSREDPEAFARFVFKIHLLFHGDPAVDPRMLHVLQRLRDDAFRRAGLLAEDPAVSRHQSP